MSKSLETPSVVPPLCDRNRGALILNADDWGCDRETTDRIADCLTCGTVSSASGMVFMQDSERAAALAREHGFDIGLHLNFTTPFSCAQIPAVLRQHQSRLLNVLRRSRFAALRYHPELAASFRDVLRAQCEEFERLYGHAPQRIDGHHHMHLAANVLFAGMLPAGTIVRRNFSFAPGEKSIANRLYRGLVDRALARRHSLADYFFSLPPLSPPARLERIFQLAASAIVEVETHPAHPDEYRFLASREILRSTRAIPIASSYSLVRPEKAA